MTLNLKSPAIEICVLMLILASTASFCESMHVGGTFKPKAAFTHIADFGFLAGGKADIRLSTFTHPTNVALLSCTTREEDLLLQQSLKLSCAQISNGTLSCASVLRLNSTSNVDFSSVSYSSPSQHLHYYIVDCLLNAPSLSYNLTLSNPKSQLSSDMIPLTAESFTMAGLSSLLLVLTLGVTISKSASYSLQHRILLPMIATKVGTTLLAGLFWHLSSSQSSIPGVLTKLHYVAIAAYQLWFPFAIVLVTCTLEAPLLRLHRRTLLFSILALASGSLSLIQAASLMTLVFRGFVIASIPYILHARLSESRYQTAAPSQSLSACRSRAENSFFGTSLVASTAIITLSILVSVSSPTWSYALVEDLLELSLLAIFSYQHIISLRVHHSMDSDRSELLSS